MPRQLYGLGSLVKSITKPVKKAVSGVKDFAKSDLGKATLLAAATYGVPFTPFKGFQALSPLKTGISQVMGSLSEGGKFAKLGGVLRDVAIGTGIAGVTDYLTKPDLLPGEDLVGGRTQEEIDELKRELIANYKNLGYSDEQIAEQLKIDLREYAADGGRMGYAMGSPEENAMKASGIMGLPLNQNPAGVTELDLRETGGFIPPVGVKEKADDIPAMLSNNEFVFTADAVRGMGDGDVNKGAERMYSMMKTLENGGRV